MEGQGGEAQGKERIRVFKLSGCSVRKVRGAGERRRKGRRYGGSTWKYGGNEGEGGWETEGTKGNGRSSAKPRCRRFGFGKSAFVGNRARSAREGRDQWP